MIKLDAQQQAIVDCNDKNIIVAAGAGSGKTRVLTERIKRLLNDGVPPMNIVSITFTNMAADGMKERLSDVPGISDAFIGTIHSFANRIYGNSGQYYEIFCWEKECELMKQLIRRYAKYCNFDEYMRFCDLNKLVELGRMDGEDIKDQFAPSVLKEIHQLLNGKTDNDYPENVRTLCKAYNIITFDDLLKYATGYYFSNSFPNILTLPGIRQITPSVILKVDWLAIKHHIHGKCRLIIGFTRAHFPLPGIHCGAYQIVLFIVLKTEGLQRRIQPTNFVFCIGISKSPTQLKKHKKSS